MVCNPSMKQTWHVWAHTGITEEASLLCGREDGGGVLSSCDWKCTYLDLKLHDFERINHMLLDANMKQLQKLAVSLVRSVHLAICQHGTDFHKSLHSEFLPEFVSISWFLLNQTGVIDMSHENVGTLMIVLCCVELL